MAIDINKVQVGEYCPICRGYRLVSFVDINLHIFKCQFSHNFPWGPHITHNVSPGLSSSPVQSKQYVKPVDYNAWNMRDYIGIFTSDEDTKPIRKPIIKKSNPVDEYPHKCPRCGTSCYIGTMTDHSNKGLNATCK